MDSQWDAIATWDLVLPPSRPSKEHIEWFRTCLKGRSRTDAIAILGATPELRDMASEEGFTNVYVFEHSEKMFNAMNQLRIYDTSETWVHDNWLAALKPYRSAFGLVMSDLTSGNVSYACRTELYQLIADSLLESGEFADKVLAHTRPLPPIEEILHKYETLPLNLETINRFNCEAFFFSDLITKYGCVDSSAFYQDLGERSLTKRLARIMKELPKITPAGMKWHYGRTWTEQLPYYHNALVLLEELNEQHESPYADGLRLTKWKRR